MNTGDTEKTRQKLLHLKAELEEIEATSDAAGERVELDQSRVGRLSRMDAMQAQQMALEAGRRRKDQLLKIEGALRRIEADDYGYCFVCGEEIDARRISVDPTTTRCLACAE